MVTRGEEQIWTPKFVRKYSASNGKENLGVLYLFSELQISPEDSLKRVNKAVDPNPSCYVLCLKIMSCIFYSWLF